MYLKDFHKLLKEHNALEDFCKAAKHFANKQSRIGGIIDRLPWFQTREFLGKDNYWENLHRLWVPICRENSYIYDVGTHEVADKLLAMNKKMRAFRAIRALKD
jgi:hypothetical protein